MQLAATTFLSMKDVSTTRDLGVTTETNAFAHVFQGVTVQVDEFQAKKHVELTDQFIEKIKQLLEQLLTGEEIHEEDFSSLPLIFAEDPQLLAHVQKEEVDWNEAIATVLEGDIQTNEQIGEEEIKLISELIDEQLSLVRDEKVVNTEQLLEMPTYTSKRFSSTEVMQLRSSRQEEMNTQTRNDVAVKAFELIERFMNGTNKRYSNIELTRVLEQAHKMNQEILPSLQVRNDEISEETKSHPVLVFSDQPDSLEDIWNNLQVMYEKRATLTDGGAYVDQAKVRSSDVASWMNQFVSHVNTIEPQQVPLHQQMTPVEQYVLHMNRQDGENEQMMQQLRQIVSQSGLGKNDFIQQLSIQIQPEQLGDMKITLLKIEGELIAKITVYSQVAKHALESQMHQLKNLFSPHQVVIEKQEGIDQTSVEQDHEHEDMNDNDEATEQEENSHHEERGELSFQEQFEQLLKEKTGE